MKNKKNSNENKSEMIKDGYYVRSTTALKRNGHCPFCGGITEQYNGSFYCETCDIDLDEKGNIIQS